MFNATTTTQRWVWVQYRSRFVIIHECGPGPLTTCGLPMSDGYTIPAREAVGLQGQVCQYGCFKGRQLPIAQYR